MAKNTQLTGLYQRLRTVGITRPYVEKNIVPPSVTSIADTPSGFNQFARILAKHLNLQLESVLDETAALQFNRLPVRYFHGQLEMQEHVGHYTVAGISQVISAAVPSDLHQLPSSGAEIYDAIVGSGEASVSLRSLLAYCWDHGIAVIHIAKLPKGVSRGMVIGRGGEKPTIVLSHLHKSPSKQLYALAHEVAHLINDDLGRTLLTASIESEIRFIGLSEAEAKRNTRNILTGGQTIQIDANHYNGAVELARAIEYEGRQQHVDPGYLLSLRQHHYRDIDQRQAGLALTLMENADGIDIINEVASSQLAWHTIPIEDIFFVEQLTGLRVPVATFLGATQTPGNATRQPITIEEAARKSDVKYARAYAELAK